MPLSDNDAYEDTKLHEAVRYGDLCEVRESLCEGLDPNQIGIYQWSPLHEAANNGDADIVRLLIKYGGEPNGTDGLQGSTAVHYAAGGGHEDCLKLLLQAGGRFDILNTDGQSCLDVAVGQCQHLLQQQRDKDIHMNPPCKETVVKNLLQDTKHIIDEENARSDPTHYSEVITSEKQKDINDNESERDSALFDLDDISIATSTDSFSSSSSRPFSQVWGSQHTVVGLKKDLVLGNAQMSFEYNSKKSIFKIRVWQISDLLLPPVETSMISGVYVKSYLQPDKKKDSKRKTEEVHVKRKEDTQEDKPSKDDSSSRSVIFKPSSFKFTKALEYKKVTEDMLKSKVVELVVCVVQKYTRKSFPVATWNLPLKEAVKKLVKEKYLLRPCLSTSLPENMKVYHAGQLQVIHNSHSSSNPNLQRRPSTGSWAVPYTERAASDSDLHAVKVDRGTCTVPSIEVTVPEEEQDQELNEALCQIRVMEMRERSVSEGYTSIEMSRMLPGCATDGNTEGDLGRVEVISCVQVAEVQVHVETLKHTIQTSDTTQPRSTKSLSLDAEVEEINTVKQKKKESKMKHRKSSSSKHDKTRRPSKRKESREAVPEKELGSSSRPDSPTWDHFEESLGVAMIPMDDLSLPMDVFQTRSYLPIAASMEMPEIHRSFCLPTGAKHSHVKTSSMTTSDSLQVRYEDETSRGPSPTKETTRDTNLPLKNQLGSSRHIEGSPQKTRGKEKQKVASTGDVEEGIHMSDQVAGLPDILSSDTFPHKTCDKENVSALLIEGQVHLEMQERPHQSKPRDRTSLKGYVKGNETKLSNV